MLVLPPLNSRVPVPTPCGASIRPTIDRAVPDVMVILKLVLPSMAAADDSAAAAAGSAAPELAVATGVPDAVPVGPGVAASSVQPATARAVAASSPRPMPASRGVRMSVLPYAPGVP